VERRTKFQEPIEEKILWFLVLENWFFPDGNPDRGFQENLQSAVGSCECLGKFKLVELGAGRRGRSEVGKDAPIARKDPLKPAPLYRVDFHNARYSTMNASVRSA
jgi:hypothetical protein